MVLDRVRNGEYSSTSELVNAAVRNLLEEEHAGQEGPRRPDLRSLELAQDAPANLDWLHRNRTAYMGEWVALHKGRLIAHGTNGLDVFKTAQNRGINPPLMHRIAPEESASWDGW
jgi:Arc/MetJ-type ribon-helix-helix transcriptional regulator